MIGYQLMIGIQKEKLDEAWEVHKASKGLVFKTKVEESNAYNIFLSGMKFAMDMLGQMMKEADALDNLPNLPTEWIQ